MNPPPGAKVAINERGALALAILLIDRLRAIADPTNEAAKIVLEEVRRFVPILRGVAKLTPENEVGVWSALSAIANQIAKESTS